MRSRGMRPVWIGFVLSAMLVGVVWLSGTGLPAELVAMVRAHPGVQWLLGGLAALGVAGFICVVTNTV